jgi:hypothetical protein
VQLAAARVVTDQVEEVVPPIDTVALKVVENEPEEVSRIAMVSPAWNPLTLVPPQTPLREIAAQPMQVAVSVVLNPDRVKVFEVIAVFKFTPF